MDQSQCPKVFLVKQILTRTDVVAVVVVNSSIL